MSKGEEEQDILGNNKSHGSNIDLSRVHTAISVACALTQKVYLSVCNFENNDSCCLTGRGSRWHMWMEKCSIASRLQQAPRVTQ